MPQTKIIINTHTQTTENKVYFQGSWGNHGSLLPDTSVMTTVFFVAESIEAKHPAAAQTC